MSRKKVCMVLGKAFVNDVRVYKEARSLVKAGCEVVVYSTYKTGLKKEEIIDGMNIKRLEVDNYNLIRYRVDKILNQSAPIFRALKSEKADVYHAHDLDTLLLAFLVAKVNKAKVVYDSHELYLENTHRAVKKTFFQNLKYQRNMFFFSLTERSLIGRADSVITVNNSIAEELAKKYKISKPIVVMNTMPKSYGRYENKKLFHKEFNLSRDKIIVLFQGDITWVRGMKQLLEAATFLPKNVVIVLMGNSDHIKKDLTQLIDKRGLGEKVKLMDAVPQKKVAEYTASADVGVIPFLNICRNYYLSAPNKLFEYMSAGLPIAASNFPEMKKIIEGEKIGLTFDPNDPKDIAAAVSSIISDQKKYIQMKANANKASQEKYNWENEEKKLIKLYNNL